MKQRGAASATIVVVAYAVHFLTFSGFALLLPLIREDLGISFAQAGLLAAAGTVFYALGQVPAGLASDRWGPRRPFFIGLLGWSALALGLTLAGSYWVALLILFAAGACRALLFAPGIALVSSCFAPERRATAASVFLVGAFVGTFAMSLTGPALSSAFGWRPAFAFYALLGLAAAAAFWFVTQDDSRPREGRRVGLKDVAPLLRHPIIWICNGLQLVRFSTFSAFNFWLPSYLVADRGFGLESAGMAVAVSAACAAAANPLGGYVSDRLRNPPLVIGGSLAIVACTSILLVSVESKPLLLAIVAAHSTFMTVYFGPLFFVPVEALGIRTAGLATGIGNFFANTGALLSAYALGVLKDATGSFTAGFYAMAVMCGAGAALSIALARVRRSGLAAVPSPRSAAAYRDLTHGAHVAPP